MKIITTKALPATGWFGGKRLLAKTIVNIINQVDHKCYAEPFLGMGGVFLRRTHKPKAEIINDYSKDVINFFRIVQKHPEELCRQLKFQIASRDEFKRQKAINSNCLTDVERAARFLYLQRMSFGGKVVGQSYALDTTGNARFNTKNIMPAIEKLHLRLNQVQIECLDWAEFIQKVDKVHTLFYLDPPYFGHENDYGKDMFDQSQFAKMADILSCIKGKFILSINNVPEIRESFANFNIKEVKTAYTAGGNHFSKPVTELIITNFSYE